MADKKEKYIYRFPPCSICDMEAMESWKSGKHIIPAVFTPLFIPLSVLNTD